jgi:hypothetical protein
MKHLREMKTISKMGWVVVWPLGNARAFPGDRSIFVKESEYDAFQEDIGPDGWE